jgi:hypothetical protein
MMESCCTYREYSLAASELEAPDPLGCGGDEVLVGRAGYVLGQSPLHMLMFPAGMDSYLRIGIEK